jgi:hypothetical protein
VNNTGAMGDSPLKLGKMRFESKPEITHPCFEKYRRQAVAYLIIMIVFTVGETGYAYSRPYNSIFFKILFTFVAISVFYIFIKSIRGAASLMNRVIKNIETRPEGIHLETFDSSIIFGLIKMEGQTVDIQRNLISFAVTDRKYALDEDYTGQIYVINYAGTIYLLPENFYDNFFELEMALSLIQIA